MAIEQTALKEFKQTAFSFWLSQKREAAAITNHGINAIFIAFQPNKSSKAPALKRTNQTDNENGHIVNSLGLGFSATE